MADFDFNAPYVDRRTWIIDHLQDLSLEPKEILVVLLIDFFSSYQKKKFILFVHV